MIPIRLTQRLITPHPSNAVFDYDPPLFLLAQVPWLWAFGPAFWYGRAISALSILATALCIGLTLHALTRDWLAAAMGGLTLLAFPYMLHWSAFNRVDSLALALSCAGLFVIARWSDRRWGLVGAALLLTAAICTRQSMGLAAPLAAFVWLLRTPPPRRAFAFAALVGGASLLLLLALNALTRGGFFFNIVTANVNPFAWDEVKRHKDEIVEHMLYLLIGGGLFLAGAAWARVGSWWLIAPYLAGASASALTIGKAGSNVNYLFELMAAFSLVAGALIAWTAKWRWLRALMLLLLAAQIATLTAWSREGYYPRLLGKVAQKTELARLGLVLLALERSATEGDQSPLHTGSGLGRHGRVPAKTLATKNHVWVFGDKHTGCYLLKFSWFAIERHVLGHVQASPDDPRRRDYWKGNALPIYMRLRACTAPERRCKKIGVSKPV